MTDTTHEAPERIWLQLGAGDEGTHTWADHQVGWDDEGEYEPEYIRADLVQAAVAAKLKEAVAAVKKDADNDDISQGAAQWVSDTILALITPDAQAALDRVVAAERERCAKVAERKAGAGSHAIAAAIRKGGE